MIKLVEGLPTFLVIGAMKAGTTSLYHYLRAHPQVFMPAIKAPEFFVAESNWTRGIDWYRRLFVLTGAEAVALGEASNAYTKYPQFAGVPQRIAAHIPDARLVYVVRDPIQRIWSHYRTRVREGSEKAPIERAVFDNPIYLDFCRYSVQLQQYLEYFPQEQLLVITSEDLREVREATMRRVYGFLGVDANFVPADLDREFYRTDDQPSRSLVPLSIRKGLKRHFPAAKRAKELENNVFRKVKHLRGQARHNGPPLGVAGIPDDVRARIAKTLHDDVADLRIFLGPEFGGWGIG